MSFLPGSAGYPWGRGDWRLGKRVLQMDDPIKDDNTNNDDSGTDGDAVFSQKQWDEQQVQAEARFNGVLRDRQQDRVALQETRQQLTGLQEQLTEATKPKQALLSDEEGETLVNKQMLDDFGKTLAKGFADQLGVREAKQQRTATSTAQKTDASALLKHKTDKTEGEGLDAATVYSETIAYLQTHDASYLEWAKTQPDYASRIDQYGRANVPGIAEKIQTRRNAELAKKLDQDGAPDIGKIGSGGELSPEQANLQAMLSGEVSTEAIDEMMSIAGD